MAAFLTLSQLPGASNPLSCYKKNAGQMADVFFNGRSERIRTSDILVPNQARYQAALRSEGDTGTTV